MRYVCLIYSDEAAEAAMAPEQQKALFDQYMALEGELAGAGIKKAGEALQPTATATTVRIRDGKTLTTDGPFAETKEQLGGFYMFECSDLDEAIKWAAKIPSAKGGSVEVRPVMEFDM